MGTPNAYYETGAFFQQVLRSLCIERYDIHWLGSFACYPLRHAEGQYAGISEMILVRSLPTFA